MKPNHKDLRFLIYENRELKSLYAINVHSESMNHALFLLRGRTFLCQTLFFYFMVETWCGAHLLASCSCTGCHGTAHLQHPPALLQDVILLVLLRTYFISSSWWEYVTCCSNTIQLAFVFILVPLLTAYITYNSSLNGSAGLEKPCIQENCVQLVTDQLHALWRQSGDGSGGLLLHILIPWANGNKV